MKKESVFDARLWLPLPWGKYYFVMILGRDSRQVKHDEALDLERRQSTPYARLIAAYTLLLWALSSLMIVGFLVAYLMKSYLGIDLVSSGHPVPEFLKWIGLCR